MVFLTIVKFSHLPELCFFTEVSPHQGSEINTWLLVNSH